MTLLIAALVGLLAVYVRGKPNGPLWRLLVDWPARQLRALTWQAMLVGAILSAFAIFAAELIIADLVWVLAVDIVGWIELFAATLVVTRLAPGWRSFKAQVAKVIQARVSARPRVSRMRRPRRPPLASDDPDPAWAFA